MNTLDRKLRPLGLELLRFEPGALMEAAAKQAKLSDFAEHAVFREATETLCRSAEQDARLTLIGRRVIRQFMVRGLVNRLRIIDAQKREPEVAKTPLVPPIHGHFKLELSDDFVDRANQFVADRPKDKYGVHVYSADDFGTSTAAVRERFAQYHQRYVATSPGGATGRRA